MSNSKQKSTKQRKQFDRSKITAEIGPLEQKLVKTTNRKTLKTNFDATSRSIPAKFDPKHKSFR